MAIYKISPVAQRDLIDIYIRGYHKWGINKTDSYQLRLISNFQLLAENPDMGQDVSIRPQMQRHEVKPYIIFYRKFSYGVRIARILYKNRAIEKHM
ncbi:hypothetical protein MNBD_GAMMA10-2409 [hydrothermal vent metagenome]|uniref:Toxin n=1 Tax=hydrothermal vent metagenome TaxID=652676 RepID=A0A3B0XW62_9ZZZZ